MNNQGSMEYSSTRFWNIFKCRHESNLHIKDWQWRILIKNFGGDRII